MCSILAAPVWNYYDFSVAVDYELLFVGYKTTDVGACNGKQKVELDRWEGSQKHNSYLI